MFSRQIHLAVAHAGSVGALGPCAQGCGPHAPRPAGGQAPRVAGGMGRKGRNRDSHKRHQIHSAEWEAERSRGWESWARGPGSQTCSALSGGRASLPTVTQSWGRRASGGPKERGAPHPSDASATCPSLGPWDTGQTWDKSVRPGSTLLRVNLSEDHGFSAEKGVRDFDFMNK